MNSSGMFPWNTVVISDENLLVGNRYAILWTESVMYGWSNKLWKINQYLHFESDDV